LNRNDKGTGRAGIMALVVCLVLGGLASVAEETDAAESDVAGGTTQQQTDAGPDAAETQKAKWVSGWFESGIDAALTANPT